MALRRTGHPGGGTGREGAVWCRATTNATASSSASRIPGGGRALNVSTERVPAVVGKKAAAARMGTRAAVFGGGGDEKPKLTRKDEPEEYWQSKAERDGKTPFQVCRNLAQAHRMVHVCEGKESAFSFAISCSCFQNCQFFSVCVV